MEVYLFVCLAALAGSGLTLFSGFGLGTILVPVFGLFFEVEVAIALTAIVHLLNNLFKLTLIGKHANREVLLRFGVPSVLAAFLGAWLLKGLSGAEAITSYSMMNHQFEIYPVKLVIGVLLLVFAIAEWSPALNKLELDRKYLPLGGILSGFFGGLSGNQGALRTAFLMKSGLTKEQFISTGVVLACFIDITRLPVYGSSFSQQLETSEIPLVISATLSAFLGAWAGTRFLKKTTHQVVKTVVTFLLLAYGSALMMGWLK